MTNANNSIVKVICVGCGKASFYLPFRRLVTHAITCRHCREVTLVNIDENYGVLISAVSKKASCFPIIKQIKSIHNLQPQSKETNTKSDLIRKNEIEIDWNKITFEIDCVHCGESIYTINYGSEQIHGVTCFKCKGITCIKVLYDGSIVILPLPADTPSTKLVAEVIRFSNCNSVSLWGLAITAGLEREITTSIGLKLRLIGPGTFKMGHEASSESAKAVHYVTITKPFYIGIYPVTQSQFEKVMGGNPSRFVSANKPVESVSWEHAVEFCKFLSDIEKKQFRLPTEAEWEYAARAGTTTLYPWGDEIDDRFCWYKGNSNGQTHEVGLKEPNQWGLYDMCGNVWEWCQDRYGDYSSEPQIDPLGPKNGDLRVIRGGSFNHYAQQCQAVFRLGSNPSKGMNFIGFRVVMEPFIPDVTGRKAL